MSIEDSDAPQTIVEAGRRRCAERMLAAFDAQENGHPSLATAELSPYVDDAVQRAGAGLWRISLAEGAAAHYGIGVEDALAHPAVAAAVEIVGAPETPVSVPLLDEPIVPDGRAGTGMAARVHHNDAPAAGSTGAPDLSPPAGPAPSGWRPAEEELQLAAVHEKGIEALAPGERDLQLRLSPHGLDVLRRSSGAPIGRLEWSEIVAVDVVERKRGLLRRGMTLDVRTSRGEAVFSLPELTHQEAETQLRPTLARLHGDDHE